MWRPVQSTRHRNRCTFIKLIRSYYKPSYFHNATEEPLRCLTLGMLLEQSAKKFRDRPAIVSRYQKQTLTFHDVLVEADRLAAGLKVAGFQIGDRIGLWAPNLTEWYVTHMACARGGYVLVNLNSACQAEELKFFINSVGIKGIICPHKFKTQDYYRHLTEVAPNIPYSNPGKIRSENIPSLETVIIIGEEDLRGTYNFHEILSMPSEAEVKKIQSLQPHLNPDSVCQLQFTSGTTGHSKAPMQSHFQIVNTAYFNGKRIGLHKKHQLICTQIPFFHVFGSCVALCAALNHGSTLVVPYPTFNADESLTALRDEKCTVIYGTPTMYVDLVMAQEARKEKINVEVAVTGGAICSQSLMTKMKTVLGVERVCSTYGLSEVTGGVFQSVEGDSEHVCLTTVGRIGQHLEAKVVDSEGRIVPLKTPGELCLRGYCTTMGYWQDDQKTKELIGGDRWLRTGDKFILEEDGYGKVVGRIKEMILRGGENIYPKDIEEVLNSHPQIIEAQVVGVPHERLGEEVCACVRVESNASITLEDIKSYCRGKIAHFKIPSRLHIMDSFPKTTSGKIQKFKLITHVVSQRSMSL